MHYYHGDQLGSTSLITNSSGGVEEKTKYYPFGQLRSGGTKTKYLYTGQEYLSSVGFYDYGFRQRKTDPPMFMQPDPVTADVYDPQGLNKYSYVRNNPVRYNDPSGEIFFVPFLLMAGVGVLYECNYLSTNSNPSLEGTLTSGFVGSTTAAAGIAGGAVAASAGGAAAASAGLAGTGTELAVAAGSSVVGGQTARGVGNILTGNDVGAGLGNVNDMTEDAIFGAASYGVVKGISSAKGLSASSSQEPLTLKPSPQSAPKETYQTSLHLYDQMAERQISLGDVKSALGGNKFSFVYKTGELQTGYYDSSTKVFVPQNSEGILKTVYKCSQESIDKKIWGKQ
ncbi:MAG TPA: RHS repeat-associated core domain-containing protein, partial [Candidatus Wunengus sp. YC60]|uniref:RHS repeat-associated core domain-containing protein n=1 Tax=Candidatus Wunengus sp. YC60 TaxID=3367697 RepID=UPI00402523AF